jgi:hypothetical protein
MTLIYSLLALIMQMAIRSRLVEVAYVIESVFRQLVIICYTHEVYQLVSFDNILLKAKCQYFSIVLVMLYFFWPNCSTVSHSTHN